MSRSSFAALLTALAVLVLSTAALAVPALGARSHAGSVPVVTVTATEFKFKLSRAYARHGKITFKLVNRGTVGHDFKIAGHKTAVISPGKTTRMTVTLSKGKAHYLCTVPGHAAAGMKGTFVVR